MLIRSPQRPGTEIFAGIDCECHPGEGASAGTLAALSEPRRGKSLALNQGIAASKGEFLIFTDDDVVPSDLAARI